MNYVLGVDIGGTKIAIGLVREDGQLDFHNKINMNADLSPEDMMHILFDEIEALIQNSGIPFHNLLGIGIGAPGPLDSKNGKIECPPNLPKWKNVNIVERFQERFTIPVRLENDCNAATLAEKWIGAAQDNDHFIYLTISTGIGAGLFSHGRLVSGMSGNAGDVGHMMIDPSYGTCTCGQKGCWEWISSGTAIARQGSEVLGYSVTAEEVFDKVNKGDETLEQMIDGVFQTIGAGCTNLINVMDPEKIVIGGGVSNVGDPLFKTVQSYVQKHALSPSGKQTEIVASGLDQHSGTIGAAAILLQDKISTEHQMID